METTARAVERLTEPHTEMTDAGSVEWPPLIRWLETRVTEIVGRKGGSGASAGVPLNTEALELLQHIEQRLKLILEAVYQHGTGDNINDIKLAWTAAVNERQGGRMDDGQWEKITGELEDWVLRIQAEDERPRKMELTVPCPRCETRWVEDEEGQRAAAVVIEFAPGRAPVAECRVGECGAMWAGWADVARLGFTVGAEQNAEILAACGIDTPKLFAEIE